ncbi:DUF4393 domain-containing protein [Flectobacillus sp. DC10W]|uniref:DUF4393 domain-containing protein n=1 Tax=Flectobacillus longus TaxID=2984207 RepID=A0ABT6YK92_9BACT|nr:DUF4393 domain-containing protein [Flectobacillus longus]MDI9864008.1 DUF4393 domain-containing protein [Flectobacillus longus]
MAENQESKESNVKSTVDAVTGLVNAIPIYQDVLQPSAQQIGKSLETVSKTVNIALAPIKLLVWGYERIEEYLSQSISEKLKDIPPEKIITPSPLIAGPAVEALKYAGHEEELRELYSKLIATAMNADTSPNAHPSFIDVIRSLSSDEAILLKLFKDGKMFPIVDIIIAQKGDSRYSVLQSNFSEFDNLVLLKYPNLIPSYLDNLCRLGLLNIPQGISITDDSKYVSLEENATPPASQKEIIDKANLEIRFTRKLVTTTNFGNIFINCIVV